MKRAILAVFLLALAARGQCLTAANAFQNEPETARTQPFVVDYDVTPGGAGADLVTGISNGAAAGYASIAAIVRFSGQSIDVMNGAAYASTLSLSFAAGSTYHVHLVVRPGDGYDAFVTPPGGVQTEIAAGYSFRASAGSTASLNNFVIDDDAATDQVCNLAIAAVSTPPPVVTPPAPPGTFTATGAAAAGTLTVSGTGTNGQPASAQFSTQAPVSFTFAATSHSVVLTWVASTSAGVIGYNVLRSASGSFAGVYATTSGTTYTDTTVTPGATYEYTVQAVSASGTSVDSNVVTVTIPSP